MARIFRDRTDGARKGYRECCSRAQVPGAGRRGSKARAGDAVPAVGGFFDVDQRNLDAPAALGSGLKGRDIHVVGDAEAEVVIVEAHVGNEGIGGIVGETGPGAGVEIDRTGLIGAGTDRPGAPEDVLPGAGLVADETAGIDGAGRSRDGEEAAAVKRYPRRDADRVDAKEGGLWPVEVICGSADIEIVVAVSARVVQDP